LGEALTGGDVRIEILPLRSDSPIYLPPGALPDFGDKTQVATIDSIEAIPEYEVTLTFPGLNP
jgi:hypothetical protein